MRCHSVDDERRTDVGPAHLIEVIDGNLGQRGWGDVTPYGVDHGVDRTERLDGLGEEPFHIQHVGDVGTDRYGGAETFENGLDGRLRRSLVVDVVDDHGVAEAREPFDRLPAHASRPAGDDRDTTLPWPTGCDDHGRRFAEQTCASRQW